MTRLQTTVEIGAAEGKRFQPHQVWVDTEAAFSQFPAALLEELGYEPVAVQEIPTPDGGTDHVDICDVDLRIGGEVRTVTCIFDEDDAESLIGAATLDDFGLRLDARAGKLVPA